MRRVCAAGETPTPELTGIAGRERVRVASRKLSRPKGASAMATTKQKAAARKNIKKARKVQSARAHGAKAAKKKSPGLSTAAKNRLSSTDFAFPKERKEPLTDARHVRNAVARFDQVEDVTDAERDRAWKRIKRAAKKFDVDIDADDWRELFKGGKAKKR
jgi:hypothetical protein